MPQPGPKRLVGFYIVRGEYVGDGTTSSIWWHLFNNSRAGEGPVGSERWKPNRNAATFLTGFVRFRRTYPFVCLMLNWMSGSEPTESAVDQILRNVDLTSIQDERARECVRLLLNLVESLTAEVRKLQAENLALREQLRGRKGSGAHQTDL